MHKCPPKETSLLNVPKGFLYRHLLNQRSAMASGVRRALTDGNLRPFRASLARCSFNFRRKYVNLKTRASFLHSFHTPTPIYPSLIPKCENHWWDVEISNRKRIRHLLGYIFISLWLSWQRHSGLPLPLCTSSTYISGVYFASIQISIKFARRKTNYSQSLVGPT